MLKLLTKKVCRHGGPFLLANRALPSKPGTSIGFTPGWQGTQKAVAGYSRYLRVGDSIRRSSVAALLGRKHSFSVTHQSYRENLHMRISSRIRAGLVALTALATVS